MPSGRAKLLNPTDLQDTHTASTFVVNAGGDYVQCEHSVRMSHPTCVAHIASPTGTAEITWPNPT